MVEGQNQQSRNDIATEFQGGTVHLCSSANAISDSATSITSDASASTADGDWTISHDNTNGTTTLENSASIDFGSPSGFVIDQIVIEPSPLRSVSPLAESSMMKLPAVADDSPSGDTDLSGDGSTSIPAGDLTYTFGGQ